MNSGGSYWDENAQQWLQGPAVPPPPTAPPPPPAPPAQPPPVPAAPPEGTAPGPESAEPSPPEPDRPADGGTSGDGPGVPADAPVRSAEEEVRDSVPDAAAPSSSDQARKDEVPENEVPEDKAPEGEAPEDEAPGPVPVPADSSPPEQPAEGGGEVTGAAQDDPAGAPVRDTGEALPGPRADAGAPAGAAREWWEDGGTDSSPAGPEPATVAGADGPAGAGAAPPPLTAPGLPAGSELAAPPLTVPDRGAEHGPGAVTPASGLPTQAATPPPPPVYPAVHEPVPGPAPGPDGSYDPYAAYTPYPGGFQLGAESEDRSRRRGVVAAVVGLAVIVAGALGAGGWLLFGDDGEETAKPQPSATAEPKPPTDDPDPSPSSEPASPSPSESAVPPGYVLAAEAGYSLAVPEDWERRVDGVSVFYEEPLVDGAFLQVYEVTEAISPYEAVQIIEETKRDADGYRLNDLADLGTAAEYDYSYVDEQLGPRRVLLHDRQTSDGRMYALLVSGPESDWPRQRDVVDEMTASFCTDTECPAQGGA